MPLGRYFAFTGGLLLALLFLADWYMPRSSAEPRLAEVDRSIIRIHTLQRWPEAVVFDTSLPTIVPPPPVVAAEIPTGKPPRDAMAQLLPPTVHVPPRETRPAAVKPRAKTVRVAVRRSAGDRAAAAGDVALGSW